MYESGNEAILARVSKDILESYRKKNLCSSSDQAFQAMGFWADADCNNTNQHQSQVEQEENQKVHPGGGDSGSPASIYLLFG